MRTRRLKVLGGAACYHCMSRTVNGEVLFGEREKEVLRKMLWQVSDYCGVEILTYAVMGNHFHVLVRVPEAGGVSDRELLRRWRVLYPNPSKYEQARASAMEKALNAGGEEAEGIRKRHLARMHDVSEFMKTVKQRFTTWFNRQHERFGPLWSDRFKSVLVEGRGNPLQTMAAYIDLNPVRAGICKDLKDYRFCGYAEAVVGAERARRGLHSIWASYADGSERGRLAAEAALRAHRNLLFAKGADEQVIPIEQVKRVLEKEEGCLPKSALLRCRIRYFTDGLVLGTPDYVNALAASWRIGQDRKHPPPSRGLDRSSWGELAILGRLRGSVFG